MLIRHFKNCSTNVKNHLFRTYCSSLYGDQLWYRFSSTMFRKIKSTYNCIYRTLSGLQKGTDNTSRSMVINKIPTFCELLRKHIYGFMLRLNNSNKLCVSTIINSVFYLQSPIFKFWLQSLY